jgi:hypothetical protein
MRPVAVALISFNFQFSIFNSELKIEKWKMENGKKECARLPSHSYLSIFNFQFSIPLHATAPISHRRLSARRSLVKDFSIAVESPRLPGAK